MNYVVLGIIALGVIAIFATIVALIKRYKRCPSDKLLVIYGRTGKKKNSSGEIQTAKVLHGGGAFIWPIIQDYRFMDLKPIPIEIGLEKALSKQNIRVDVPATFTVAISTETAVMQNAAERLLGLDNRAIAKLAEDIIFGQMRLVIATMDIESINADRDTFLEKIQQSLEPELQKIGLKLINVNVTDIRDDSGYILALGKEAAAQAINDAKVSVAGKNRDGEIGETLAFKEQRIKVAEANTAAQIGEANAAQDQRVQVASANSKAQIGEAEATQTMRVATADADARSIEGENKSAVAIAQTTSDRKVAEAEAFRASTAAENVSMAKANEESYKAQETAEKERANKDRATQYANTVVPAEVDKEKILVEAAAEADKVRTIAQGHADATYAKMEAEAKGINEILTKTAEGYDRLVKAAGSPEGAVSMILADKIETIIEKQVEAIKNVKIDNITVWDSGSGSGSGNGGTADFLQSFLKFAPPMEDAFKMVGAEFPSLLQGEGAKEMAKLAAQKSASEELNQDNDELQSENQE